MSGGLPRLRVLPDAGAVADAAAEEVARILGEAIASRGAAHWSTTGGSAAPPLYLRLRRPPLRDRVDWSRVHVWWGDDRFVPPDHPESNVLPLAEVLLGRGTPGGTADGDATGEPAWIPADQVHQVPVSDAIAAGAGPELAAARYAAELRRVGPETDARGLPRFDLVLLGIGPDGHILSVFPGSPAWDSTEAAIAIPAPTHVQPHVARITLHPGVVAIARAVLVVATGASKADPLGRAWTGDDLRELPARAARIPGATWLLDEAAAARLPVGGR